MRSSAILLDVIGALLVVLGIIHHFAGGFLSGISHGSLILVVVGIVVLAIGVVLGQSGRQPVVK